MKYSYYVLSLVFGLSAQNSLSQNIEFWGLVQEGADGYGAIVSTDENGNNYKIEHAFGENTLSNVLYGDFIEIDSLKFYGIAYNGGAFSLGGLFEYNKANGAFKVLRNFNYDDGELPGHLVHINQKIYGLTRRVPGVTYGVLYEYDLTTGQFSHKIDFDTTNTGSVFSDGLTLASNGKLYGVAGGFLKSHNRGYIFEYDPNTDVYKKLYVFSDTATSGVVLGHMIQAGNGKLYGMSCTGGMHDMGVIFEYDIATNQYEALHHFDGTNGGSPYMMNSLTEYGNGHFYGMTVRGGLNNKGVLFEFNLDSMKYTLIHHFTGGLDGGDPHRNLTVHSDGKLYGMTRQGGTYGHGIIFTFDSISNSIQQLLHFNNNGNGRQPGGTLCSASDGNLYSATPWGTKKLFGSIFQFNPNTKLFTNLNYFNDRSSGANPQGQLLHHSNGLLYGAAKWGDKENGILFSIDPVTKKYTVEHEFSWRKGQNPTGFMSEGDNAMIYGISERGGNDSIYGFGVIFKFNPISKALDTILTLKEGIQGRNSYTGWVKGTSDRLYTTVNYGGKNGGGTLLSLNTTNDKVTVLHSFTQANNEFYIPVSPTIPFPNGKIYGLLARGGTDDKGGIYEYNTITGELEIMYEFQRSLTGMASSQISRGPGNLLYGSMIPANGNVGSIYSFNPETREFVTEFNNTDWENGVLGSFKMLWASNDNLYGFTTRGGDFNDGTFYEFDPDAKVFTKKLDFDGYNGTKAQNSMIEINGKYNKVADHLKSEVQTKIFPNPASNKIDLIFPEILNKVNISVLNMEGKEVLSFSEEEISQMVIDIQHIPSAVYTLQIQSQNLNETLKVIKVD